MLKTEGLLLAPPSPCLLLLLLSTCPEPSAPPQDIKCAPSSSTSLLVAWRPPPVESQNGALAGYTVRYQVEAAAGSVESAAGTADNEETSGEVSVPSGEQVLLPRLEKWTQYRISVAALTHMGSGPESELLSCRTDEDGTEPPTLSPTPVHPSTHPPVPPSPSTCPPPIHPSCICVCWAAPWRAALGN